LDPDMIYTYPSPSLIPNPTPNPTQLHPLDLDPTLPPGSRVLQ